VSAAGAYTGLAAEYNQLLGPLAEQTWRQGVLVDVARLGVAAGATVVDLGAGTGIGGRLLHADVGGAHRVGVDATPAMLAQAGTWYERTVLADLRDLPLETASAALMVSGFDTINYLDADGLARCLPEVSRCLIPGGWLIFDYSSPQLLRGVWRDRTDVQEVPGGRLHWRHRLDPDGRRCVSTVERRDDAGVLGWREQHVQYALDTYDLHVAVAAAGLRVERVRDLHREQFSSAAHTHVWALRKEVM
jgi:SAM-dependent methyltransferase